MTAHNDRAQTLAKLTVEAASCVADGKPKHETIDAISALGKAAIDAQLEAFVEGIYWSERRAFKKTEGPMQ